MSGAGGIAVGAAGGVVLLIAGIDLFITVFNYDGFTFLASRLHAFAWSVLRGFSRVLPDRARHGFLSIGSATMLPSTLLWWLALEMSGFAMMYLPGLAAGDFKAQGAGLLGAQGAFYLSGGDLTSLTFGDLVAHAAPYRALVDLETVVGLATFTIGLTYVLAAFDALSTLNKLHGRVRRQAIRPNQPASILTRHFRQGQAEELTSLVQALVDDLAGYDDALRRYPVVFYFHSRRTERSIPRIYAALGELIELLRWGLPASEPTTTDPYVLALEDQYEMTGDRLLRSFVGPPPSLDTSPEGPEEFTALYGNASSGSLRDFAELRENARSAAGLDGTDDPGDPDVYRQFTEWLGFHARRCVLSSRLQEALCYDDRATEVDRAV